MKLFGEQLETLVQVKEYFFEAVNACGVLQVPTIISVWDDEYGISVHNKDHTTKESISKALAGFKITPQTHLE